MVHYLPHAEYHTSAYNTSLTLTFKPCFFFFLLLTSSFTCCSSVSACRSVGRKRVKKYSYECVWSSERRTEREKTLVLIKQQRVERRLLKFQGIANSSLLNIKHNFFVTHESRSQVPQQAKLGLFHTVNYFQPYLSNFLKSLFVSEPDRLGADRQSWLCSCRAEQDSCSLIFMLHSCGEQLRSAFFCLIPPTQLWVYHTLVLPAFCSIL